MGSEPCLSERNKNQAFIFDHEEKTKSDYHSLLLGFVLVHLYFLFFLLIVFIIIWQEVPSAICLEIRLRLRGERQILSTSCRMADVKSVSTEGRNEISILFDILRKKVKPNPPLPFKS